MDNLTKHFALSDRTAPTSSGFLYVLGIAVMFSFDRWVSIGSSPPTNLTVLQ